MSERVRWEYFIHDGFLGGKRKPELDADLAQLGAQGWEVVGFERATPTSDKATFVLKRQVVE